MFVHFITTSIQRSWYSVKLFQPKRWGEKYACDRHHEELDSKATRQSEIGPTKRLSSFNKGDVKCRWTRVERRHEALRAWARPIYWPSVVSQHQSTACSTVSCKYDKISRITPGSIPKFNQVFCRLFVNCHENPQTTFYGSKRYRRQVVAAGVNIHCGGIVWWWIHACMLAAPVCWYVISQTVR